MISGTNGHQVGSGAEESYAALTILDPASRAAYVIIDASETAVAVATPLGTIHIQAFWVPESSFMDAWQV